MTTVLRFKYLIALGIVIATALARLLIALQQPAPTAIHLTPAGKMTLPQLQNTQNDSFNQFDIWGKTSKNPHRKPNNSPDAANPPTPAPASTTTNQ